MTSIEQAVAEVLMQAYIVAQREGNNLTPPTPVLGISDEAFAKASRNVSRRLRRIGALRTARRRPPP